MKNKSSGGGRVIDLLRTTTDGPGTKYVTSVGIGCSASIVGTRRSLGYASKAASNAVGTESSLLVSYSPRGEDAGCTRSGCGILGVAWIRAKQCAR